MSFGTGILGSIAASVVFFIFEPYLLALEQPWRIAGAVIIFLILGGGAYYLNKKNHTQNDSTGGFLLDNEVGEDADIEIEDTEVSGRLGVNVLTKNKVGGSMKVKIRNSKF